MKLKDKETGEIGRIAKTKTDDEEIEIITDTKVYLYKSISEVCKHWEDYEEPKEYWYINEFGTPTKADFVGRETLYDKCRKNFGNYFETEEEAEKAVEKLKAWKRLKEAGFEFSGWTHTPITKSLTGYNLHIKAYSDKLADYMDDLELIFGGGE